MDVYELVRGPLVWMALILFLAGCLYQVFLVRLAGRKEPVLEPWRTRKDAIRSIFHGLLPFGTITMRGQPFYTIVTLFFHLSVVLLPIFLMAHIVLVYESWGIQWWSFPDILADTMTVWVILACVIFLARRIFVREVRRVTRPADVVFIVIILMTCLTGFLAYHQWGPYRSMLILHILSGEILLILIPFSRLSHMLFFFFSRAHLGGEYGKVLGARDW